MEILEKLGTALGLASLAGINLYLTVFVVGLAIRLNWVELAAAHQELALLGDGWVLAAAGVMFVIEFFADKIPWLDSAWDGLHTVIRPAGGALLGLTALGDVNPTLMVIAGILGGGAALTTHGAKAGTRLLVNMSPEPVSNSVASVAEDGFVLGGLALLATAPVVSLFVFLVVLVLAVLIIWKTFGFVFGRRQERRVNVENDERLNV